MTLASLHQMHHSNTTTPTIYTPPTQHRKQRPMHHPTTTITHPHQCGGAHHHNDQHHRPILTHRPATSHRIYMISTHNPPIIQPTHPTDKPLGTRTPTLPPHHTWHRIQVGPKLDNRHGHVPPILHHPCNNNIQYPTTLSHKHLPTPNRSQGHTYTAFAECPRL